MVKYFKKTYPETQLALLIENDRSWEENLGDLGFDPDIYSCYYDLLTIEIESDNRAAIPRRCNQAPRLDRVEDVEVCAATSRSPTIGTPYLAVLYPIPTRRPEQHQQPQTQRRHM